MKKAILYMLLVCALQLLLGFAAMLVCKLWFPEVKPDAPVVTITIATLTALIILSLFYGFKWCPVSRDYIRTRPWWTLAWTVVLAVGMIIPLTWLEEMIPASWRIDLIGDDIVKMFDSTVGYFVVCMLVPLMEETVFRGAIIRALVEWFDEKAGVLTDSTGIRRTEWWAILLSALFFALIHFNPAQMPHAFVVGILLGWLFVKTGSIVPGCIVHWINNSASYALVKAFPTLPHDAELADYFGGNELAVYKAVGFSLLIALPALYQLIMVKRK